MVQGREPGAPSGLRGCETAPEKASATSQEKQGVKNAALLFAKQRARLDFPLRNSCCCCWSQFPATGSPAVTAAASAQGNFLLPSVIPDAPNKMKEAENGLRKGFLSLDFFFFSPKILNI